MPTYYAKNAGSILADNAWNTTAAGDGTDMTFADGNAAGHTLDLNGKTMTSPTGTTLTCALLRATTGTLTPTGTLTINGNVTYGGTILSGMVIVGSGATLTVNGEVSNTSTGCAISVTGTGSLAISNVGATAISAAAGRAVSSTSVGTLTITGAVTASGGIALRISGNSPVSVTGNMSATGAGAVACTVLLGTVTLDGEFASPLGTVLSLGNGTVTWSGSRTLAADADCYISMTGGTLNIASLVLTNSGNFVIYRTGGAITTGSGGTLHQIVQQTSAAQACLIGSQIATAVTLNVVGPTLPDAGDVKREADGGPASYGYAGDPVTPTLEVPTDAAIADAVWTYDGAEGRTLTS